MLERDVIAKANAYAKKRKVQSIRMHFGKGVSLGWPDYLYLIPGGRPLFIEYKAPGKTPTPTQLWRISTLKELGYDVHVCDTPDSAISALAQALDAARLPGASG